MSTTEWVFLIVYLVGYLWSFRRITWLVAHDIAGRRDPDGEEIVMATIAGLCFALLWPVAVPFIVIFFMATRWDLRWLVMSEPRSAKRERRYKQRLADLKERERKIRNMELEAGLDPLPLDSIDEEKGKIVLHLRR